MEKQCQCHFHLEFLLYSSSPVCSHLCAAYNIVLYNKYNKVNAASRKLHLCKCCEINVYLGSYYLEIVTFC